MRSWLRAAATRWYPPGADTHDNNGHCERFHERVGVQGFVLCDKDPAPTDHKCFELVHLFEKGSDGREGSRFSSAKRLAMHSFFALRRGACSVACIRVPKLAANALVLRGWDNNSVATALAAVCSHAV